MEALKITAILYGDYIKGNGFFPLDAILLSIARDVAKIPLKQCNHQSELWFFASSFAQGDWFLEAGRILRTQKIYWYCYGDGDRISSLLNKVEHVGMKSEQNRTIKKWEIQEQIRDCSIVDEQGNLMRSIPAFDSECPYRNAYLAFYAVRPPYYERHSYLPCFLPSIKGKINTDSKNKLEICI